MGRGSGRIAYPSGYRIAYAKLPPMQKAVAQGLARGETHSEIADRLGMGKRTVRSYIEEAGFMLPGSGSAGSRLLRAHAAFHGAST